jgi:hypothetical protein
MKPAPLALALISLTAPIVCDAQGVTDYSGHQPLVSVTARDPKCVSDLQAVFRDPLAYQGAMFCGRAYSFVRPTYTGFFGKPGTNFEGVVADPILFIEEREAGPLIAGLHSDDEVFITGRLEPEVRCFEQGVKCTPFRKPISIHTVSLRKTRN